MTFRLILWSVLCLNVPGAEIRNATHFDRDNSGKPLPRFSNGFAIFYEREASPWIQWFSLRGEAKARVQLSAPNTSRISIADACANADGTVVIAAAAYSTNSDQSTSVLFWLSSTGQIKKIVRLAPFVALKITFIPNGHLWAFGKEIDVTFQDVPQYNTLREFDQNGIAIRSVMPVQSFGGKMTPAYGAMLATNGSTMAIYTQDEYIEVESSTGSVGKRVNIPSAWGRDTTLTAAVLTPSGKFYLGGVHQGSVPVVFSLDRSSSRFLPVEIPTTETFKFQTLLSSEGEDLIFYTKPSGTATVSFK